MILVSQSTLTTTEAANSMAHIDVLRMMLGNTRWALDFSLYILNELFDLADEFESVSADQEAFSQKCWSNPYSDPKIVNCTNSP